MDALERILGPGRDLLTRVDAALLTGGAPASHPIWPLLRRVGALPGETAESVARLAPATADSAAAQLRSLADEYARRHAAVGQPGEWTGAAAEAFGLRWTRLGAYLGGTAAPDEPSLAGRLSATAAYLDETATWMRSTRDALAAALALVLGSAEAVSVRTGVTLLGPSRVAAYPRDLLVAAAAIGVQILDAAAKSYDAGTALSERWTPALGELVYRQPIGTGVAHHGGSTTVAL